MTQQLPSPLTSAETPDTTPFAQPDDLRAEGERARKLSSDVEGVKSLIEGTRLVNDLVLAQVLFALWDNGFYEYSLTHRQFEAEQAATELNLDPVQFRWLLDYLAGRGILHFENARFGLTPRGVRLSNILVQGTMNLYIGGYGPLLTHLSPLLRREISQADFKNLRSARHTVKGTEQLISVRTVPPVLKILAARNLTRVLHLACRTGEFLLELTRSAPHLHGVGIEKIAARTEEAQAKARHRRLDSRVHFINAELGTGPLALDHPALASVDCVVALYFFHEVGRFGRPRVVEMLRQLRAAFPGRLLLFMETLPADAVPPGKKPPSTFTQLDYLLIHRIRDQGLPLPAAEWKSIIEEAGLRLVEAQEIFWSALYLAQL